MRSQIKIMIADDQALLIGGMELLLAQSGPYKVVGTVQTLDEIIPEYIRLSPDILICDIRFKEKSLHYRNGLDVLEKLLDYDKNAKVIMHSQFDDGECIRSAFLFGAKSFLSKDSDLPSMLKAINEVALGNRHVPDDVAKKLAMHSISHQVGRRSPVESLSSRQLEIFILIAKGKTQEEIASFLSIHKRTVTSETRTIKEHLKIDRPSEFTMLAIELGYITPTGDSLE